MDKVYAIITACGLLNGEPDCIRIQERGPPILVYQCRDAILGLKIEFETMKLRFEKFSTYVIVEERCEKETLPYGHKPSEEET